ncbi:MAG: GntR family transcriptional regulator [Oscillospiraceae bacterium]|nr:GntR family transcriptional regulator [Oscillospiraceae bacterium]
MRDHKPVSLANQIFERLENDILTGKYQRGELLTEIKLSEILGVSRTPIREALRRLEQEHLIEETSKGSLVLGITQEDLRDIYLIRQHIEGLAAFRAAQTITDEQLGELSEILDLQEFYAKRGDAVQIKGADHQFHELIYRYSGSNVIYNTLKPLHKKVQKYRQVSVQNSARALVSVEEHREILNALAAHDAELAQKMMTEHVINAYSSIAKIDEERK